MIDLALAASYTSMAEDTEREAEAKEWIEGFASCMWDDEEEV